MTTTKNILFFNQIAITDIARVGGKNASLGEMYNQLNPLGVRIPNGFALTAEAYRFFREKNNVEKRVSEIIRTLDTKNYANLAAIGEQIRALIGAAAIPQEIIGDLDDAYRTLSKQCGSAAIDVAVRDRKSVV